MLIFNCHHVEAHPRRDPQDPDRHYVTITPEGLRNYIRLIRRCGWEIVSMKDALTTPSGPNWDHQVIFTFDDGYVNNLTEALPVLEAEQCPATIFILSGQPGGHNDWDQSHLPEAERDPLMTLEQLKTLARSPWITYGSHGHNHVHMAATPAETLREMITTSHTELSREFGDRFIPVLAYPWGEYNETVLQLMAESSFRAAVTTVKGPWKADSPAFEIPRYSVFDRDATPLVAFGKWVRNGLIGPREIMHLTSSLVSGR